MAARGEIPFNSGEAFNGMLVEELNEINSIFELKSCVL